MPMLGSFLFSPLKKNKKKVLDGEADNADVMLTGLVLMRYLAQRQVSFFFSLFFPDVFS
jgi:hypothetical protein